MRTEISVVAQKYTLWLTFSIWLKKIITKPDNSYIGRLMTPNSFSVWETYYSILHFLFPYLSHGRLSVCVIDVRCVHYLTYFCAAQAGSGLWCLSCAVAAQDLTERETSAPVGGQTALEGGSQHVIGWPVTDHSFIVSGGHSLSYKVLYDIYRYLSIRDAAQAIPILVSDIESIPG